MAPLLSDLRANVRHPVHRYRPHVNVYGDRPCGRVHLVSWLFHRLAQQRFSASLRAPQMNAAKLSKVFRILQLERLLLPVVVQRLRFKSFPS
jgi:hypothetical protein